MAEEKAVNAREVCIVALADYLVENLFSRLVHIFKKYIVNCKIIKRIKMITGENCTGLLNCFKVFNSFYAFNNHLAVFYKILDKALCPDVYKKGCNFI